MEERIIKWLDIDEMRIIKEIIIVSDRINGEIELGRILYKRQLSEEYNFKKQQEEDKKHSNETDNFFLDYPQQENYPSDRIDEIIFEAIRKDYPKSIIRNDTMLFDVDKEKIDILKKRKKIKSLIYFSPEFSKITNFYDYVGKTFSAPKIDINIYSYFETEFLNGHIFYANYNVAEEQIIDGKIKNY